jgi:hypothetical protein
MNDVAAARIHARRPTTDSTVHTSGARCESHNGMCRCFARNDPITITAAAALAETAPPLAKNGHADSFPLEPGSSQAVAKPTPKVETKAVRFRNYLSDSI